MLYSFFNLKSNQSFCLNLNIFIKLLEAECNSLGLAYETMKLKLTVLFSMSKLNNVLKVNMHYKWGQVNTKFKNSFHCSNSEDNEEHV